MSKELLEAFHFAYVWGRSTKHSPQRVGLNHLLEDEDVLQIVTKTVKMQTQTKGYSEKAQVYNSMVAVKRREKTKAGRKKRGAIK